MCVQNNSFHGRTITKISLWKISSPSLAVRKVYVFSHHNYQAASLPFASINHFLYTKFSSFLYWRNGKSGARKNIVTMERHPEISGYSFRTVMLIRPAIARNGKKTLNVQTVILIIVVFTELKRLSKSDSSQTSSTRMVGLKFLTLN